VHRIAIVVASLLCSILVMPSGVAAKPKSLTLDRPVQLSKTMFRLTGRAPKPHRVVVLQRLVDGDWVRAARLRVAKGVYRTNVRASADAQRYRTVAGRLRSPVRTVPASRAPVDSNPTRHSGGTGSAELGPIDLGPIDLGPVELGPIMPHPVDPKAQPDACGAPRFRADGTRRACTFADDFDGASLDRTKWLPQSNFITGDVTGSYACYRDHPDNVSVSNGALQLTVRREPAPLPCGHEGLAPSRFTGGGVSTYHLFSQRYGRFEARFKNTATTSPGLQEAFWLWPDDRQDIPVLWPEAGEIDIIETYSQYPYHGIPFLHYTPNDNGGPVPGLNTAWNCGAARGVWNTYALEWTPTLLLISVNGVTCLLNTSGDVAFQRKYIVALTQGLGLSTNGYVEGTPMPARMSVDYVRVWE
jgi:beta-glucanase (GH16 family)